MSNIIYNREVLFRDKEGNKSKVEIEITTRNGYPELTFCGDYSNGGGQIVDDIKPKNEYQEELINIWYKYHINGMIYGTEKQMNIINSYIQGKIKVSKDVEEYIQYRKNRSNSGLGEIILSCTNKKGEIQIFSKSLKLDGSSVSHSDIQNQYSKGLISEIDYVNSSDIFFDGNILLHPYNPKKHTMLYDGDYKYGSSWFKVDLPENIIELLDTLCDNIEGEESNNLITIDMLEEQFFVDKAEQLDCEVEKLMAGCLQEEVTVEGLDNIEVDDNRYTIEGNDWLICTDEEADEAHLEDIENFVDELGFEGFNKDYISGPYVERLDNGNIEVKMSIEISPSERANALNRRDGYEYEQVINGTRYYLYKQ